MRGPAAWVPSNTFTGGGGGGGGGGPSPTNYEVVNYVATGLEGTDFTVNIGVVMLNDNYGLLWAPAGVAAVPVIDLPNILAGDRTTTQFRVVAGAALTAGDKLTFIVFAV
jgi:hypothetical protein